MTPSGSTPYLYRPIRAFDGRVLKCCGIASDTSRAIVQAKADGIETIGEDGTLLANGVVIETPSYRGDRIHADTLEPCVLGAIATKEPSPSELNGDQLLALFALKDAVRMATDSGLFAKMAGIYDPDRIAVFCDDFVEFANRAAATRPSSTS